MAATDVYSSQYYNTTTGVANAGYPRRNPQGTSVVPFHKEIDESAETSEAGDRVFIVPLPTEKFEIVRLTLGNDDLDIHATPTVDIDLTVYDGTNETTIYNAGTFFQAANANALDLGVQQHLAAYQFTSGSTTGRRDLTLKVIAAAATPADGGVWGSIEYRLTG